jgi:hypothetical protein
VRLGHRGRLKGRVAHAYLTTLSLGFLDKMQLIENVIFWIEEC